MRNPDFPLAASLKCDCLLMKCARELRLYVRFGSKGEELTVSITSPLCGAKADIATRSADFAFGPRPDIQAWRSQWFAMLPATRPGKRNGFVRDYWLSSAVGDGATARALRHIGTVISHVTPSARQSSRILPFR